MPTRIDCLLPASPSIMPPVLSYLQLCWKHKGTGWQIGLVWTCASSGLPMKEQRSTTRSSTTSDSSTLTPSLSFPSSNDSLKRIHVWPTHALFMCIQIPAPVRTAIALWWRTGLHECWMDFTRECLGTSSSLGTPSSVQISSSVSSRPSSRSTIS